MRLTACLCCALVLGCSQAPTPRSPPVVWPTRELCAPLHLSETPLVAAYRVLGPDASCRTHQRTGVFIHGFGDVGHSLADLAKRAAPCSKKILIDLPGMGQSPPVDADAVSPEAVFSSIEDIIAREAPGDQVVLVGHSMGGTLALRVAARSPEKIAAVAAISAPNDPFELGGQSQTLRDHWRVLMPLIRALGPYASAREWLRSMLPDDVAEDPVAMSLIARQLSDRRRIAATEGYLRNLLSHAEMSRMVGERAQIRPRLWFVYGTRDSWTPPPPEDFRAAAERHVVMLEGIGHLPHLEAPHDTARAIRPLFADAARHTGPVSRRSIPSELHVDTPIYAGKELFPVLFGGFALGRRYAGFAVARGSIDPNYPLEAGRVVAMLGAAEAGESPSYFRASLRAELVWPWVGGPLLEVTGLGGDDAIGGYAALGYVPSVVPWVRAYVGYGFVPGEGRRAITGVEIDVRLDGVLY